MPASLALDLACALDAVALARRVGLKPDPWQSDVLRSTSAQLALCCSRQSGKSVTTAALVSHTALYGPGALSIVLAPAERQSVELLRTVRAMLRELGEDAPEIERDNTLALELANGSRVLALPGKDGTIRGYSGVRLLVVDEAARVPDPLYFAVRPMLAVSGGRLVLLSTPYGKRGFFHKEFTEGGPAWRRFMVPAEECPRISPAFLEEERRSLPRHSFDQEYRCQFIEAAGSVFDGDDLARMFGDAAGSPIGEPDSLSEYRRIFG